MSPIRAAVSLLFLFLLSSSARGDDIAQAREHNRRGTKAYDLGRYVEAAKEYESAYEIVDDPALLYNIGQAFRLGGDSASALRSYRSYLRRVPNAANRSEVESRIAEMQTLVDQQQLKAKESIAATAAPQPLNAPQPVAPVEVVTAAPPRSKPIYKRWWLWTAVVAVAAVGIGVGLGIGLAPAPSAPTSPTNGGTFRPFGQ